MSLTTMDRHDEVIRVAAQFSRTPGGRYKDTSVASAEEFREKLLLPALVRAIAAQGSVVVDIDGVFSLPSSFLEEAFGGAVRAGLAKGWSADDVIKAIRLQTSETHLRPYDGAAKAFMRRAAALKGQPATDE